MALIRCPECNSEVSERAATCPRCGFPIRQKKNKNLIKIKLPEQMGLMTYGNCRIIRKDTGVEIGRARHRAIFEFEASKPVELEIRVPGGWSGFTSYTCYVKPGKKYDCSWSPGFIVPKLICNEVDYYDSE